MTTGDIAHHGPLRVQQLNLSSQAARRRAAASRRTLFSNEVLHLEDHLLSPERCALVRVTSQPDLLAVYSKQGLAAATFLGQEVARSVRGDSPSHSDLVEGLAAALAALCRRKRALVGGDTCYRLVHGEADGFPGLVIDHYDSLVVAQSANQQGDFLLPWVFEALRQMFPDTPLLERSASQSRLQLGLQPRIRAHYGPCPAQVEVCFAGLTMAFRPERAQKTGLFLDQRQNLRILRDLLSRVAAAAQKPLEAWTVLDLCCYAGAWSAVASEAGCGRFVLVDQDADALSLAEHNVRGAAPKQTLQKGIWIDPRKGDLFQNLGDLRSCDQRFDLVIADPPAFARSRKNLPEAQRAYARLTKMAARLVRPGGLLVVSSCSRPLEPTAFEQIVADQLLAPSAPRDDRRWVLVSRGQQSPDHTLATGVQGCEYLKALFYQRIS